MRTSLFLAAKDLRIELRSREMLVVMFLFSLIIVLAFRFAFYDSDLGTVVPLEDLAPAALWICFSFAVIIGMHAAFERERDRETLDGLLLCPVDRSTIFVGKVLSNLVIVFVVNLLSIMFFSLFFSYDFGGNVIAVIAISFLGTVSLVLVGTLVAAISINARARAALLPILLLPLIAFTVIMPAVIATRDAILGGISDALQEIQFIAGFAILFAVIGYLTFDYILEG